MMHRSVVMFLHAVGVEAMRSESVLSPSLQNNPTHSDKLFGALLDDIVGRSDFGCYRRGKAVSGPFILSDLGFFPEGRAISAGRSRRPANIRVRHLAELSDSSVSEDLFKAMFTPAGKDVRPSRSPASMIYSTRSISSNERAFPAVRLCRNLGTGGLGPWHTAGLRAMAVQAVSVGTPPGCRAA